MAILTRRQCYYSVGWYRDGYSVLPGPQEYRVTRTSRGFDVLVCRSGTSSSLSGVYLVEIRNLEHSLAKVFSSQHANQAFNSIIDAVRYAGLCLERLITDPLADILVQVTDIGRSKVGIGDDEASYSQALADYQANIFDAILLLRRLVVLRNIAASN